MKMIVSVAVLSLLFASCNSSESASLSAVPADQRTHVDGKQQNDNGASKGRWKGTFSNGMKGATISFEVDGNKVKDVTFQGYWRCDGKLELTTIGPEKEYILKGKAVDGTIKESGFYFELHGNFNGNKASGTLRFAFVAGGCDTYKLNWTAAKQ